MNPQRTLNSFFAGFFIKPQRVFGRHDPKERYQGKAPWKDRNQRETLTLYEKVE
jgi:hypothetical protein